MRTRFELRYCFHDAGLHCYVKDNMKLLEQSKKISTEEITAMEFVYEKMLVEADDFSESAHGSCNP